MSLSAARPLFNEYYLGPPTKKHVAIHPRKIVYEPKAEEPVVAEVVAPVVETKGRGRPKGSVESEEVKIAKAAAKEQHLEAIKHQKTAASEAAKEAAAAIRAAAEEEKPAKTKAISQMNLGDLQAVAINKGIDITGLTTKRALKAAINQS